MKLAIDGVRRIWRRLGGARGSLFYPSAPSRCDSLRGRTPSGWIDRSQQRTQRRGPRLAGLLRHGICRKPPKGGVLLYRVGTMSSMNTMSLGVFSNLTQVLVLPLRSADCGPPTL